MQVELSRETRSLCLHENISVSNKSWRNFNCARNQSVQISEHLENKCFEISTHTFLKRNLGIKYWVKIIILAPHSKTKLRQTWIKQTWNVWLIPWRHCKQEQLYLSDQHPYYVYVYNRCFWLSWSKVQRATTPDAFARQRSGGFGGGGQVRRKYSTEGILSQGSQIHVPWAKCGPWEDPILRPAGWQLLACEIIVIMKENNVI